MTKPKNRFFVLCDTSDELYDPMRTKEEAEHSAFSACENDVEGNYWFVAEMVTTYFQTKEATSVPYEQGDADPKDAA